MATRATAWNALLAAALVGLTYSNWQLYEANIYQAIQIRDLSVQATAVENVRSEVMGQVEDALGAGAAQLFAAADRLEGRIATLEREVDGMQGIGYSPGLSASLDELERAVDDLRSCLNYLASGLSVHC